MTQGKEEIPKELLIAKYFIFKSQNDKKLGMTNKKLQKLLYYAQAWSLVFNKQKLFNENIEAWVHGPTVPSIYHTFKTFGFSEINDKTLTQDTFAELSEKEKIVLDTVWEVYGKKYEANYLETLTHSEDPWQIARQDLPPYESSTNVISTEEMQKYYERKLAEAN